MFLYIDATAGGMLLQILLGGFTGLAVIGRLFWGRITGRGSKPEQPADEDVASSEASGNEIDRAA